MGRYECSFHAALKTTGIYAHANESSSRYLMRRCAWLCLRANRPGLEGDRCSCRVSSLTTSVPRKAGYSARLDSDPHPSNDTDRSLGEAEGV